MIFPLLSTASFSHKIFLPSLRVSAILVALTLHGIFLLCYYTAFHKLTLIRLTAFQITKSLCCHVQIFAFFGSLVMSKFVKVSTLWIWGRQNGTWTGFSPSSFQFDLHRCFSLSLTITWPEAPTSDQFKCRRANRLSHIWRPCYLCYLWFLR